MKTLPIPFLLGLLIIEGYERCLPKTACTNTQHKSIALVSVKGKRLLDRLSDSVDKYFNIKDEPRKMAEVLLWLRLTGAIKTIHQFLYEKLSISIQFFKRNLQDEC